MHARAGGPVIGGSRTPRTGGPPAAATPRRFLQAALGAALLLVGCRGDGARDDAPRPPSLPVRQAAADAACEAASPPAPAPADTIDPRALSLAVNLPAYRLDVREGDSLVASYRVAIGSPRYPTPTGSFAISRVEWNPWWTPPASDWARGRTRTPPGPANPLGPVKLEFAPLYLVHGTPDSASIGTAASHGCVRLHSADAVALAERVQRFGAPAAADSLDSPARRGAATRAVRLERAVPIVVRYELLEARGDTLHAYPDVYGQRSAELEAAAAASVAAAAGLDSAEALKAARHLLDRARDTAVATPRGIPGRGTTSALRPASPP